MWEMFRRLIEQPADYFYVVLAKTFQYSIVIDNTGRKEKPSCVRFLVASASNASAPGWVLAL
jgi:hypothetical protein